MHTPKNVRKRGNLPREATAHLKEWLRENRHKPYPTDVQKSRLCSETNLTGIQVANWFINARRRILPSMLLQDGREPNEFLMIKKNVVEPLSDLPSDFEEETSPHSPKSVNSPTPATPIKCDNTNSNSSTLSASTSDSLTNSAAKLLEKDSHKTYFNVSPTKDWSIEDSFSRWSVDDPHTLLTKKVLEGLASEKNGLTLLALSCEIHINHLKAEGLWDR